MLRMQRQHDCCDSTMNMNSRNEESFNAFKRYTTMKLSKEVSFLITHLMRQIKLGNQIFYGRIACYKFHLNSGNEWNWCSNFKAAPPSRVNIFWLIWLTKSDFSEQNNHLNQHGRHSRFCPKLGDYDENDLKWLFSVQRLKFNHVG